MGNGDKLKHCIKFKKRVAGKINYLGMVRGKNDSLYLKFCKYAKSLDKSLRFKRSVSNAPIILTEGKSDWKHLAAALVFFKSNNQFTQLNLKFAEFEHDYGDSYLRAKIKDITFEPKDNVYIAIFDAVVGGVAEKETYFKRWRDNVYSFRLPRWALYDSGESIEFCYKEDDRIVKDDKGRRLFVNSEFSLDGVHHLDASIVYNGNKSKLKNIKSGGNDYLRIIDDEVMQGGVNIALTKSDFAENILSKQENFKHIDLSGFKNIFELIERIIRDANYI